MEFRRKVDLFFWITGLSFFVIPTIGGLILGLSSDSKPSSTNSGNNSEGEATEATEDPNFGAALTPEMVAAILATAQAEAVVATAQAQAAVATAIPTSTPMPPERLTSQTREMRITIVKDGPSLYTAVKGAVDAGQISFPIIWVEGNKTWTNLSKLPSMYAPGDTFTLKSQPTAALPPEAPVVRNEPPPPSQTHSEQPSMPAESQSGIFTGVVSGERYWVKLLGAGGVEMQKQVWLYFENGRWVYSPDGWSEKIQAQGGEYPILAVIWQ